jgi:hypothetical protein
LYIAGGTATLHNVTLPSNTAQGGVGGRGATFVSRGQRISTPGGRGGDGSGGGLFVAAGALTLHDGAVISNSAAAGAGGAGGPGPPPGANGAAGSARGGGLFIEVASSTRLDEITFAQVTNNMPSNFHGPFDLLPNLMPADFNSDGAVGSDDLTVWQDAFGTGGAADADFDADSDGADFLAWQQQFGNGLSAVSASAAAPEPTTAPLAALTMGALLKRRRLTTQ